MFKRIQNNSLQEVEIFFKTPEGPQPCRLKPREIVTIPEAYITNQIKTLTARRILRITAAQ